MIDYMLKQLKKINMTVMLCKIVFVVAITFLLNWTLYASVFNFDFAHTLDVMMAKQNLVYASMVVLLSFYIALKLVVSDYVLTTLIYSSILAIISVFNYFKVLILELPIFPSDLQMMKNAKELTGMISFKYLIIIIAVILVVVLLIGGVAYLRLRKRKKKIKSRSTYLLFGVKFLCSLAILMSIRHFYDIKDRSQSMAKYVRSHGFQTIAWNQLAHYQLNGPVIGYFSNFKGEIMSAPEGYSKANIFEIEQKYQTRADEINQDRANDTFDDINVIYILSESLSNPNRINGVTLNDNPIPFISSGEGMSRWGTFLSPAYGGSTANVEFEILTSMLTNLFEPSMRLPYQDFVSTYSHFDSIVSSFNKSHAIHAYNAKFYKREGVFKAFGFDTLTFEPNMVETERIQDGAFILDKSSYAQILEQIRLNDSTAFYHLITMQNHGGYSDIYPEYNFEVEEHELLDDLSASTIKYYTEGINITDKSTQEFIESIDLIPEKTIVFFYGDHAPGIYQNFKEINEGLSFYETDYFIHANFDTNESTNSILSTLGVNATIYDLAGVKVDAYMALLTDLSKELISIRGEYYVLPNEELVLYDQLPESTRILIDDYQMMVYSKIKK